MPQDNKSFRLLRLLLFLSGSYPRRKDECTDFLQIKDSSFYNYCNELKNIGFDLRQKDGKYWVECAGCTNQTLANLLHFTEEEAYILAKSIDNIEGYTLPARRLKEKLVSFLNQEKAVEAYLQKEKSEIVKILNKAIKDKRQILIVNYSSGNSQSIRNRMVEPFEFKEDFTLIWAFDTELCENRQFKVCRMGDVELTDFGWKHEREHHSLPVDVFRNTGELTKVVEFELNVRARNLLAEEYPLSQNAIKEITKNRYLFKTTVAKYEGPGRFVLGIADDIKLVGDKGFLRYLKEKVASCEKIFKTP